MTWHQIVLVLAWIITASGPVLAISTLLWFQLLQRLAKAIPTVGKVVIVSIWFICVIITALNVNHVSLSLNDLRAVILEHLTKFKTLFVKLDFWMSLIASIVIALFIVTRGSRLLWRWINIWYMSRKD
jgi:hypothetical protein